MPGLFCRETEVGARTGSGGCGLIARDAGIVAIAVDVYIVLVFGFFSFFLPPRVMQDRLLLQCGIGLKGVFDLRCWKQISFFLTEVNDLVV
jgi:hypothetical protein